MVFAVDRRRDLAERVIPFFQTHPLLVKDQDFRLFTTNSRLLDQQPHFTEAGFEEAVRLAYRMNGRGKQRQQPLSTVLAGSSETARQARSRKQTVKIQSDPHGDVRSEAEMTLPSVLTFGQFRE